MVNRNIVLVTGTIIVLFLLVVISQNILSNNKTITGEVISNLEKDLEEEKYVYPNEYTNIEELHFGKMPILYSFETECPPKVKDRIYLAFETIQEETDGLVRFEEDKEIGDIWIYCNPYNYDETINWDGQGYLDILYGTGEPIIDEDTENLINYGRLDFYGAGLVCKTGYPALEVHEILHILGFGHSYGLNDVMRAEVEGNSADCKVIGMGDKHVNCLKYIYSNGEFNGNCENINFLKLCKSGYSLGYDNECHKDCEEGYFWGEDYSCYKECGYGHYCEKGYYCLNGECYLD